MVSVSLAFVVENLLTAVLIIAYLAYEIRWGRLSVLARKLDAIMDIVIALVRETPTVSTEKVVERLNGDSPDDLILDADERDDHRGGDDDYYAQD